MSEFDLKLLSEILNETTAMLRKDDFYEGTPELVDQARRGEAITGGGVLEIFAMPHESEITDGFESVDLEFVTIGVDKIKAEARRETLISILTAYPNLDRLAQGPSYIEVGGEIGDQGAAFKLFALGKVLGLWSIITPETFGFSGHEARMMAGRGYVMITGWHPTAKAAA